MELAISLLWMLLGIIAVCLVIYLILYGLRNFTPLQIPPKVEQGIWFIVLILVIIWVLTALAGRRFIL